MSPEIQLYSARNTLLEEVSTDIAYPGLADRSIPLDETIYTNAVEFRPERWYKNHEMIKEPSAYAPFSKGKPSFLSYLSTILSSIPILLTTSKCLALWPFLMPQTPPISFCSSLTFEHFHYFTTQTTTGHYNCIGKPLALQILRTTLAKLVLEFDVSFAPGEDGAAFSKNARTQFTTTPGELYLKFSKRKK